MLIPVAAVFMAFAGSATETCEWGEVTITGTTIVPRAQIQGNSIAAIERADCPVLGGIEPARLRLLDPSKGLIAGDGTTHFRVVIENWEDISRGRVAGFEFAKVQSLRSCGIQPGQCYEPDESGSIFLGVEGEAVTVIWSGVSLRSLGASSFRVRANHLTTSGSLILSITVRPDGNVTNPSTEVLFRDLAGNAIFLAPVPLSFGSLAPEVQFVPSGASSTDTAFCEISSSIAGCVGNEY